MMTRTALLTFLLLPAAAFPQETPPAARRPNIVFILVDDQSPWDLKAYNPDSPLETPNIDRLAREGAVLDAAYHMGSFSGAVCVPSRHMIMTGRTVWHLPISPQAAQQGRCPPDILDHTLPAVFNRAGYVTVRTCKQGNSYEAANKQFSIRQDATKRGGTPETGSAWHGDRVMEYLDSRAQAADTRPFLIYFGFSHPHDVRDGTPELLAKYGAVNHTDRDQPPAIQKKTPRLPPNWLPGHPFRHGDDRVRDETQVSGVWERRDEATIRNELGREFACSENIDLQIGRVLEKIEAMGELQNTFVFYTADHGMAIGRHGLQGKQNLYEHTWRVPFLARGPGIPAGRRAPGHVYLLDVLATLCDLAGIPAPASNEGLSMRPVLEGRQPALRDTLYGVYCGGAKPGMRAVRQGDWKLLQYESQDGAIRRTQLFNLRDNPLEFLAEHANPEVTKRTGVTPGPDQRDLADDPRFAAERKRLEGLLLTEMRRLHDPWRMWNQPDDGLTPPQAGARRNANQGPKRGEPAVAR